MTEPSGADVARLKALIARQRRELDGMRSQAAARSVVDLATGMLMEQLHCSPAEARRQLARLARESGDSVADLAAQITRQPPPAEAEAPRSRPRAGSAWPGRPPRRRPTAPPWPPPCWTRRWPQRAPSRWRSG